MPFGQNHHLGVDLGRVDKSPLVPLGTRSHDEAGGEYVYIQANGAITGEGYFVNIDEVHQATMLTATNGAYGDRVGAAQRAFLDDEYGWVKIYGASNFQVLASCAANVVLAATATAGAIDDATGKTLPGAALTTARAASPGLAPGWLNYPTVGATT